MVVLLGGGLGNQMFEYAYARALQEEYGLALVFNACELRYHSYEGRSYALDKLAVDHSKFLYKNDLFSYIFFKFMRKKYLKDISCMSSEEKCKFLDEKGLLISVETYSYYKHAIRNRTRYMYGNFQSWKYFEKYNEKICNELRVIADQTNENKRIQTEIKNVNSVCVHVRRGDYVKNPEWKQLNICTYEYYSNAIKYIMERVEQPVFYVFSNDSEDIKWIKENYDFSSYNVRYVDLNNPDFEELRLMYSCKHFIISNSTFSWWAQHLSENRNRIVVAPSMWNMEEDAKDLYEENWILIRG